jgi:predicted MPP superfamily phosphohydrolase
MSMNRRTFLKSLLYAGTASLAGGSAYALHSVDLEITRQQVGVSGLERKLRVVAVSDIHAPCYYLATADLICTANAQKPDVLILAGDTFGVRTYEETVDAFKNAEARLLKLAVPGNWEYHLGFDPQDLKKAYAGVGIAYLINDACEVGGLRIVGLDDLMRGAPRFEMVDGGEDRRSPLLVIDHCPAGFDRMASSGHNGKIVISGHTHGGQIAPFGQALVTPPGSGPYVKGWYRRGRNWMYVMRGVGTSSVPVRLGARPEMLVMDLVPV